MRVEDVLRAVPPAVTSVRFLNSESVPEATDTPNRFADISLFKARWSWIRLPCQLTPRSAAETKGNSHRWYSSNVIGPLTMDAAASPSRRSTRRTLTFRFLRGRAGSGLTRCGGGGTWCEACRAKLLNCDADFCDASPPCAPLTAGVPCLREREASRKAVDAFSSAVGPALLPRRSGA